MSDNIIEIMVIHEGLCVFNYSNNQKKLLSTDKDEQLLSGLLSAIQSFSMDLGTEIKAVKFHTSKLFYRTIRLEKVNITLIFITESVADEEDIKIRMEYAAQIFVRKFQVILKNTSFIDSNIFTLFQKDIERIVIDSREMLDDILPVSYLQALIFNLQTAIPVRILLKTLEKYGFFYDNKAKKIISPADLSYDQEKVIEEQLESTVKKLFGTQIWEENSLKARERSKSQIII